MPKDKIFGDGDIYAQAVIVKGPDFVLLVLELLQKGVRTS